MALPDRTVIEERLDTLIAGWTRSSGVAAPAVFAVAIEGFEDLSLIDPDGTEAAMDEVARRIDRLVRNADLLGRVSSDVFVLVTASTAPAHAGAVIDRISGAVAMPVEVAGQMVSLASAVGLAFCDEGRSAAEELAIADADLARIRIRRR